MTTDTLDLASFGADLLRELCAAAPGENIFVSPVSLAGALALAYNGAVGPTARAMAAGMRLRGQPDHDALNAAMGPLLRSLAELDSETSEEASYGKIVTPEDYKIWMQLASALWLARGLPVEPAYLERVRQVYDAAVAPATDAETINAWVAEKTAGKIDAVVARVEPDVSYLISAVYFRAGWASPFERHDTQDGPFHLLDGTRRTLPMMRQYGKFAYLADETSEVILLPLGNSRNGRSDVSFMVALPRPEVAFAEFCAAASARWWADRLAHAQAQTGRTEGEIQLPRFKLTFADELSATLSAMGMEQAFADDADFSALTPLPTHIQRVIHKTFLHVDEEGVEAGAASSVEMKTLGALPTPFTMVVDRPFLCALVATRGQTALFMGAITNPEPA